MGIINNIIKSQEDKKAKNELYLSSDNYLLFGTGKSSLVAGLSSLTPYPVLALSPAGGSTHLTSQFPNFISYSIGNFSEYETLISDLERTFDRVKKIFFAISNKDEKTLAFFQEALVEELGSKELAVEEFNILKMHAMNNTFPISAIVIEEANIISNWKQDEIENTLEINNLGEDKKALG